MMIQAEFEISEAYIRAATSKQIDNSLTGDVGYGYQIWCEEDNGFSFRGMGSQFALVYPERELAFACNSDTQMMGHIARILLRNVFREELLAKIQDRPLPADDAAGKALEIKLDSLNLIPQQGSLTSSYVEK
ncbi:hypothetical protein [Paenibacillus sp.]|uniref:hypothetical protein n=1 Tax=Paenibacillus sp. TaxID=58172 RepID=UPI002810A7BE|nr:hypothetical protein [Paenibacillus sp.]